MADFRKTLRKHRAAIGVAGALAVVVTGYTTCEGDDAVVKQIVEAVTPLLADPPAAPAPPVP